MIDQLHNIWLSFIHSLEPFYQYLISKGLDTRTGGQTLHVSIINYTFSTLMCWFWNKWIGLNKANVNTYARWVETGSGVQCSDLQCQAVLYSAVECSGVQSCAVLCTLVRACSSLHTSKCVARSLLEDKPRVRQIGSLEGHLAHPCRL